MADSAAGPQANGSVYTQLFEINGTVQRTAAQITALHEALLGERGHIRRIDDDIARLYSKSNELASRVQSSAATGRSWRDRVSGGWGLVLAAVVLLDLIEHALEIHRLSGGR